MLSTKYIAFRKALFMKLELNTTRLWESGDSWGTLMTHRHLLNVHIWRYPTILY